MSKLDVHFSSANTEYPTPHNFYNNMDWEFNFRLDVCATPENAKCPRFFTKEIDGLAQIWAGNCWMNPPYNKPEQPCKPNCKKKKCQERGHHTDKYVPGIIDWMEKAYISSLNGATVVCLIPARTDTDWWHTFAMQAAEIRLVKGRLAFGDAENTAPFPSAVTIFRPLKWWQDNPMHRLTITAIDTNGIAIPGGGNRKGRI